MNVVFVKHFNNKSEAELAKNLLEAEGIWSTVRLGDLHAYGGSFADADLLVKELDLELAKSLLNSHE